jgi:hypothetical protein
MMLVDAIQAAGGGKKDGGGKGPKGGDIPMPTSKDVVPVNYLKGQLPHPSQRLLPHFHNTILHLEGGRYFCVYPVKMLKGVCVGVADGKDPPLLPDDQYPDWLFEMRVRIHSYIHIYTYYYIYIYMYIYILLLPDDQYPDWLFEMRVRSTSYTYSTKHIGIYDQLYIHPIYTHSIRYICIYRGCI